MLNKLIGGAEIHVQVCQEQVTIRYTGLEGGEMSNSGPQYTDQNICFDDKFWSILGRKLQGLESLTLRARCILIQMVFGVCL
jgi:hypothetical protein